MSVTFGLTVLGWIFFRAENIGHAMNYLAEIFSGSLFTVPVFKGSTGALITFIIVLGFIVIEWLGREGQYAISKINIKFNRFYRWSFYFSLILLIYFLGNFSESIEFIYFQF